MLNKQTLVNLGDKCMTEEYNGFQCRKCKSTAHSKFFSPLYCDSCITLSVVTEYLKSGYSEDKAKIIEEAIRNEANRIINENFTKLDETKAIVEKAVEIALNEIKSKGESLYKSYVS